MHTDVSIQVISRIFYKEFLFSRKTNKTRSDDFTVLSSLIFMSLAFHPKKNVAVSKNQIPLIFSYTSYSWSHYFQRIVIILL